MQNKKRKRAVSGKNASDTTSTGGKEQLTYDMLLEPLDSNDVGLLRKWRNDYRIWRWCRQNDFISDVDQMDWFRNISADKSIKMYKAVIEYKAENENEEMVTQRKIVGVCGFTSICHLNQRAEFSLYIAPDLQGHGFGETALRCLILHGFSNKNLRQIWGESIDGNPAIPMFEKLGFKREGTLRQFYFKDGTFHDAHRLSILRDEWKP